MQRIFVILHHRDEGVNKSIDIHWMIEWRDLPLTNSLSKLIDIR